jgi:hypothetical protein
MGLLKGMINMPRKHPVATLGIAGTGASLAAGLKPGEELEEESMKNYTGTPGAKYVYAELESVAERKAFLEKKAAFEKNAFEPRLTGGALFGHSLTEGLGMGIGKSVGQAGIDIIRALVTGVGNSARLGPTTLNAQQQMLVARIVQSDPMLHTFDAENPGVLAKAYTTMVHTAPHVSEDPNVVLSFLREASQTGGTINYMTMKHLAEAEKAFMEARNATRPWF